MYPDHTHDELNKALHAQLIRFTKYTMVREAGNPFMGALYIKLPY